MYEKIANYSAEAEKIASLLGLSQVRHVSWWVRRGTNAVNKTLFVRNFIIHPTPQILIICSPCSHSVAIRNQLVLLIVLLLQCSQESVDAGVQTGEVN